MCATYFKMAQGENEYRKTASDNVLTIGDYRGSCMGVYWIILTFPPQTWNSWWLRFIEIPEAIPIYCDNIKKKLSYENKMYV